VFLSKASSGPLGTQINGSKNEEAVLLWGQAAQPWGWWGTMGLQHSVVALLCYHSVTTPQNTAGK